MYFLPLRAIRNEYPRLMIEDALSQFSCKRDADIESFLKNRAI